MTTLSANSLRGLACALLCAQLVTAQVQRAPAPVGPPSPAPAQPSANANQKPTADAAATTPQPPAKEPSNKDRRRAVKLYLSAARFYENQQFEQAFLQDSEAAKLDPTNRDYSLAAEAARSHAVTALIQQAAGDRIRGDATASRAALAHAAQLDPQNSMVAQHIDELADEAALNAPADEISQPMPKLGGPIEVEPAPGQHSFHLRGSERLLIQQVFHAYGVEANLDDSVRGTFVRLDLDDVPFAEAARALGLATNTFFVPIDAHRVLVALDTRDLRRLFMRNAVETFYLSGMTANEMTEFGNMAKTVFMAPQSALDATSGTLTLRAPEQTISAFSSTYRDLMQGRSEVLLDVKLIQLAHMSDRNTGIQPPQTITAFNVYAEEQSILNANQSLVQQIISSGLASPNDPLAILGILVASGQVAGSIFSNGIALFGGGLTLSGLSLGPATANLNLNSSDSRELDDYRLRLEDGEEGTLKSGTRYPITTSSYSSMGSTGLNIPGLTGAGLSSSLSSILASLQGSALNIPQVEYQDLGLVFKARPSILRSGEVALSIDVKISALAGPSINGVPVLANRSYSGAVRVRANGSVVLAGELDKSESLALSGLPGLSEIPGLSSIAANDNQQNYATLLIILTPRVVRMPHGLGHSPMVRIDNNLPGR